MTIWLKCRRPVIANQSGASDRWSLSEKGVTKVALFSSDRAAAVMIRRRRCLLPLSINRMDTQAAESYSIADLPATPKRAP
jgi:hypothetical protein